jgi:hypothetical protein
MRGTPIVLLCCGAILGASASQALAADATACTLTATERLSPGLTALTPDTSYTIDGSLTCSGAPGSPAGGQLKVGVPVTINGIAYRAPAAPTAAMSCQFSNSTGKGIVQWAGGGITVFSFNEAGSGAALHTYRGTVDASIELTRVQPDPVTHLLIKDTIATSRFIGDRNAVEGAAVVSDANPTACTDSGVASETLTGVLAFGSAP